MPRTTIRSEDITDSQVGSAEIATDAVDSAEIATDAVDTAEIAANAVGNSEMADDAVGVAELSATGTASSTTILYGDNTWKTEPAGGATSQSSAPAATAGAFWHDTTENKLKMYDGTGWFSIKSFQDGSTAARAIDSSTPITALLAARDETDGSISTGIYWFKNGEGATYTFPTLVSNYNSKTWILMQKNFVPHANKNGDSVNSDDHAQSYGLMNGAGAAIITTSLTNGSVALGTAHAGVYIDSFADATFTKMLVLDRHGPHWHQFDAISNLHTRFREGQNAGNGANTAETFAASSRQSGAVTAYYMFRTKWDAGDNDWSSMGLTDNNSNGHDVHNDASEYEGISFFMDGGADEGYLTNDKDSSLTGTYGNLSIWVAE